MNNNYGEMGIYNFCKPLKIEKTITYAFNNVFAVLKYYQRRSERLFELILVFQGGFWHVLY